MAIKLGGLELGTPGDIIVGGGAYAVGFAVDAFFFSGGATSATTAGACAAGALSVKYAIQGALSRRKSEPQPKTPERVPETTLPKSKSPASRRKPKT